MTEPYLHHINNFTHRSTLIQLRISAHTLKIETGCYTNTPAVERFCDWCNFVTGQKIIENESHFLTKCVLNSNIRFKLFNEYSDHNNLLDNSNQGELINIFQASIDDKPHNIRIAKALSKMIKTRQTFLDNLEKSKVTTVHSL